VNMKKNDLPYVSIILPTYNVGEYIDRCLESCVQQTLFNIEIIVVDDCGSDSSIKRAKRWAAQDSRIKIVVNDTNRGTYHARRVGVEAATARYIIFLDPDDTLALNASEVIYNAAVETCADIVFFKYEEFPIAKKNKQELPKNSCTHEELMENIFQKTKNLNYGTPGKAFSRESLIKSFVLSDVNVECKLIFAEDVLIFFVAALNSEKTSSTEDVLYNYFRNPGSATTSSNKSDVMQKCSQIDKVVAFLRGAITKQDNAISITEMAGKKVIGKLLSDKALISRYVIGDSGESYYLSRVLESWLMRGGVVDLLRAFIYIISFGKVAK
jgi:glycosyltransferase involved in cell wall biosynthesis